MRSRSYGADPLPLGRILLISLSLVVLDALVFSQFRILGVRPLPVLLLTVIAGLELGSNNGTIAGFVAGLSADVFGVGRLGTWALICGLMGFAVGFARDHAFPAARERLPLVLIVGSSWIGVLSYVGISYIVDESPVPPIKRIGIALLLVSMWNVVLGWPVRLAVRRLVGEELG